MLAELIEKPEPCDFGTGEEARTCGWGNTPNVTAARSIPWIISRGDDALFKGGPRTDHTENNGAGTLQSVDYEDGSGDSAQTLPSLLLCISLFFKCSVNRPTFMLGFTHLGPREGLSSGPKSLRTTSKVSIHLLKCCRPSFSSK